MYFFNFVTIQSKTTIFMKKATLLLSALALSFAVVSCGGNAGEEKAKEEAATDTKKEETAPDEKDRMSGTLNADTAKSFVHWKGTMVGVYSHEGNVKLTKGFLEMDNGEVVGGEFVVDMKSIEPTDENYNPEEGNTPEKLVGHLSSDDFFAVTEYPTASFVVKSADREAKTLTGDLTIRGNTHEETVTDVNFGDGAATGMLVFDRQKYDVSWKAMKDMVLADEIELEINLVAQK